jgi:hypothetical protein
MKKASILTVVTVVAGLLASGVATADAAQLEEVSGTAHGTVFPGVGVFGAPLLGRFQYHFTSGDHHIRQVAAMPLPQQSAVEVTFADENGDDNYGYRVSHERVDPAGIVPASFHGTCAGQCNVPLFTRPAGDFVFVLSGFRFGFDNGDHHLDMIGVSESGSRLTVQYKDTNGDDPFTYDVSYAWVPRSRLGFLATVSNTVHATGTATGAALGGEKVIRGFFLDNTASGDAGDNHIRDLGIEAQATSFEVQYGDANPGDSADWRYQIQYATLV